MNNKEIASILEETAVLMELKEENPFKIRAYQNGARILSSLSEDIQVLVDEGRLSEIKGIGKGLTQSITELVYDGKMVYYEELKSSFPASLFDLFRIPGLGPKKIKALYKEQNIDSISLLEYACKHNNLVDMDGFGVKTQQKILLGIEQIKKFAKFFHLRRAETQADYIVNELKKVSGIIYMEIAGSLRRKKETVKDIDIIICAEENSRQKIMDVFTSLDRVIDIIGKGETKSSVKLESGINCDLRIVSEEQYPYALMHFTGSKEHNTVLRGHSKKLGLKQNEYGLFKGETNIPCKNEEEIYRNLNMDFIPPEMRENTGEIEAALEGKLPVLIEDSDLKGVIHVHTTYSDGYGTIEETANFVRSQGYFYLGVTDHSRSAFYANGLSEKRVSKQIREIDELNKKFEDFRIFKGIESDILPDGSLDYPDDVLEQFDFVIVSIHSKFGMTEDEATERIITALENPYSTILGHPTGRLLLDREGYPLNMYKVIDAAARLGKIIELNANPYRLDIDWRYLKYAKGKNVLISINPDAHRLEGVHDDKTGIGIARKGWLEAGNVLNTRSIKDVDRIFRSIKTGSNK